jgi:hypothetical protein
MKETISPMNSAASNTEHHFTRETQTQHFPIE